MTMPQDPTAPERSHHLVALLRTFTAGVIIRVVISFLHAIKPAAGWLHARQRWHGVVIRHQVRAGARVIVGVICRLLLLASGSASGACYAHA